MKASSILKVAALAVPLLLASCHSKKTAVTDTTTTTPDGIEQTNFMKKVSNNTQEVLFVTSKLKFTVEYGTQKLTLTGNLRMHRNDVIQLQLMAFGFVEAGRIELTKDDVLILDRINKQYLKAPYNSVDFLRNSGINFYTIQALLWNELFMPGSEEVDETMYSKYKTLMGQEDVVISLEPDGGKMNYSWLANEKTGLIRMANIAYRDKMKGNTQLNWDYQEFSRMEKGGKLFPSLTNITLTSPEKELKLGIRLNYIKNESDWELRTTVSDKYRRVEFDEILRRLMALG